MLASLCDGVLEKVRHHVRADGVLFEIDEFGGDNAGLVVAEVELDSADQVIDLPDWIGAEVTDDARYYNVALASRP
jgi:adenylate cyclase